MSKCTAADFAARIVKAGIDPEDLNLEILQILVRRAGGKITEATPQLLNEIVCCCRHLASTSSSPARKASEVAK